MHLRSCVKFPASIRALQRRPATPTLYPPATPAQANLVHKAAVFPSHVRALHSSQTPPPSRWVSDIRARIGKCISFGCNPAQVQRAAGVLSTLAKEWCVLSAGSEGYLTGGRRGLENQQVVHRRIAARTFEDVAIYDYRDAKKTVLPGFMLDVFRETWRKQEEQTEWARGRIWSLLREVELLEKETWDREDAVEDLGGARK
ncbi:hypothetical protein NUW58_g3431 [Xylaria curta]|uniref:Uncharacterized protein n=1 Tax=Xylaria curta TaxID=42375 RepID=A0ACC1PCI2_9PEZI|nr:hypothetical protein NUW58_g3431 [Xylaria curta]